MLYQLHELRRALLNPLTQWAEIGAQLYNNPYSPLAYTPLSRRVAANYELLFRLGKEYEKPKFDLHDTEVDGERIAIIEENILVKPFCILKHFRRVYGESSGKHPVAPKILVFAPLSGHHATLLRNTVDAMLPDHDVYITDWVDARMVPLSEGPFHLNDYVYYCMEFIRLLGPDVHLVSVCQPTVPVLAAVSLMATAKDKCLPRSMTMMGGPIDTRQSPTAVNNLATRKPFSWFENNVIYNVPSTYPGYMRRVYPGFLQHAGFVSMNPNRHMQSHWDFYLHLLEGDGENAESHRRFYDEYNAVLDLPAEYYLDTIKTVFQEHALPKGKWLIDGVRVAPEDIQSVALFTIEGELDDISGLGQTRAAHDLCTRIPAKKQLHFMAPDCGHYGIFSGRRWREIIYPKIREFIRENA
ncbi:MAG: polyhydroxyalkanoate depolymerase [Burkholderiaceae bacterium]|jgi:poly(3-hydroxybutyrate) depolymerase